MCSFVRWSVHQLLRQETAEAKVSNFDLTILGEEYIGRFDISVQYIFIMHPFKAKSNLVKAPFAEAFA